MSEDLQPGRLAVLNKIANPVAFARSCLAHHHLLGNRDEDELVSVAINAMVTGALAWSPSGGRSLLSWCWMYMDKDVQRARRRIYRQRDELGRSQCITDDETLRYDSGTEAYHRAELRIDLQRWADLADLTDHQRFLVEWGALHEGTHTQYTPLHDQPNPFIGGKGAFKDAVAHMRRAALTNKPRDDVWTRRRHRLEQARQASTKETT